MRLKQSNDRGKTLKEGAAGQIYVVSTIRIVSAIAKCVEYCVDGE